jgi:hypothetical protein
MGLKTRFLLLPDGFVFADVGRICRLQLLLVLASAVILGSESRGTRDHILLSQIREKKRHSQNTKTEDNDDVLLTYAIGSIKIYCLKMAL